MCRSRRTRYHAHGRTFSQNFTRACGSCGEVCLVGLDACVAHWRSPGGVATRRVHIKVHVADEKQRPRPLASSARPAPSQCVSRCETFLRSRCCSRPQTHSSARPHYQPELLPSQRQPWRGTSRRSRSPHYSPAESRTCRPTRGSHPRPDRRMGKLRRSLKSPSAPMSRYKWPWKNITAKHLCCRDTAHPSDQIRDEDSGKGLEGRNLR